jgi:hypothetical protein
MFISTRIRSTTIVREHCVHMSTMISYPNESNVLNGLSWKSTIYSSTMLHNFRYVCSSSRYVLESIKIWTRNKQHVHFIKIYNNDHRRWFSCRTIEFNLSSLIIMSICCSLKITLVTIVDDYSSTITDEQHNDLFSRCVRIDSWLWSMLLLTIGSSIDVDLQ